MAITRLLTEHNHSNQENKISQKPLLLAVETSSRIGSVAIALGEKILAESVFSAPLRHSAEIFPAIYSLLDCSSRKPDQIEQVHISVGPGSFTGLRIAVTFAKTIHLASAAKVIAVNTLDVIAVNANDYIREKDTTTTSRSEPSGHSESSYQSESYFCHSERSEESPEIIATILDAKRGQFFIAVYKRPHENTISFLRKQESGSYDPLSAIRYPLIKILPDCLMTASQFLDQFAHSEKPIWLLGDGLLYYKDKFKADAVRFLDQKYWSPRASKVHLLGWKKALTNQFADPLTLTPNYLLRPDIKIQPR